MVSIVILAYNKAKYTRGCLLSVLQTRSTELELIVVDNGSTDETQDMLRELESKASERGVTLKILRQAENIGCSTARNLAVEEAAGAEVVFLDNDIVVRDPEWLLKLKAVLDSEENAAIVGPKLCYPVEPYNIQCAGVGISKSGRVQFRGRGDPQDDPRFSRVEEVQALISACFIFRRRLYDEIGGLDEAFNPIQYEDFDFCYRARSRGYRVIYTPDPVIHHWESVTSDGSAAIPNRYVIIKHGMLFKKRWRHMFEHEDGPRDEETRWKVIEMPSPEP